jgi:CMP-2-keto-3-deoxyoctulosonic acid synthetase
MLLHLGLYAYRTTFLVGPLGALKPTPAELAESLEQVRGIQLVWRDV